MNLAKKTTRMVVIILVALSFALCGCGKGSKVAKSIEENAAKIIEFFPEPITYPPSKNRIHNNYRFIGKGNSLIIQLDYWRFNKGRKNMLHHYTLPLDQIDPVSSEITDPEHRVGPISYKGGKTPIEPKQIILRTRGRKDVIQRIIYDRGKGRMANSKDDRFRSPSDKGESEYISEVVIYAPNGARADSIINAFK